MRIGVDARPLQNNNRFRGIGRYLQCLLRALAEIDRDNHYVFYVESSGLRVEDSFKNFAHKTIVRVAAPRLGKRKYFRSVLPPHRVLNVKRDNLDILFQPDVSLGVPGGVPVVAVFYDLIPYLFRESIGRPSSLRQAKSFIASNISWQKYKAFLRQYRKVTALVAISKASKLDFEQHLQIKPPIPVTITLLAATTTLPKAQSSSRSKDLKGFGITGPYLLYIGGIDIRKNIAGLARAFYEAKREFPDLQLVMVGKEFGLTGHLHRVGWDSTITSHPDYKDILMPGFVNDTDLASLYRHAAAFVFPSRYEGFGMPILEAMQSDCPVITYRNSSITEISGSAALLVRDGESIVPSIRRVMTDKALRQKLIRQGRQQAAGFTWHRTARQTLDVLQKTVQ